MNRKEKIEKYLEGILYIQKLIGTSRDAFLKKFGLNKAQMTLLYYISKLDRVTTGEISKEIGITSGAVTQIVDGLVRDGLVKRLHSKEDRRVTFLSLTDEGKDKFESLKKAQLNRISGFLEDLNDEELNTLLSIQEKLVEKFNLQSKEN